MIMTSRNLTILILLTFFLSIGITDYAWAQEPAPIPRAVVSADAAPETMTGLFTELEIGENIIDIEGAEWLQLKFTDFQLGRSGLLTISDAMGQSQTFTQKQLEEYEGISAFFNGSLLTVTLTPGEGAPGVDDDISANIGEIIIGLPSRDLTDTEMVESQPIIDLLGEDLDQYIPEDLPRQPRSTEQTAEDTEQSIEDDAQIESICEANDDRIASSHPFTGRIMPIGCTGWIIEGGALLTAGHCIASTTEFIEFNVPASQSNGTPNPAQTHDQYRIIGSSIVEDFTGLGNDWAMFQVLPNTETGLTPIVAQGGGFELSNTATPNNVEIIGYGVDGPPPHFGNPPPRNSDNQTQQTHLGSLTSASDAVILRYAVDTQGGNSGGPVVIADGSDVAIGIHTNGGCTSIGTNAGTSFHNDMLWATITAATIDTDDIIWQNRNGQVHYWPIQNGRRQSGTNIHTPVSGNWTLAGVGDVDGDSTDDIIWQNRNGQVHYWPMQNGQRRSGINIHTPVSGNWTLAGVGDVDGDSTDDIIWQNRNGQVHYWPMQNGQRQGGIDIHTPVSRNWILVDVGDVDGDGTDDIVWQHRLGQVHYWPMQNGQRQGGIDIHTPVSGDWTLTSVGDVNGDGTDDIVWQHRLGQVHYWPMQNGQRQGGIDIHTPVSGDWSLVGTGNVD